MRYDFVAGPYWHENEGVREWRAEMHRRGALYLLAQGRSVFAPIVQGHALAEGGSTGLRAADWWVANLPFLTHATRLTVLEIPGWEESEGTQRELEYAERHNIQIAYLPFHLFKDYY